MKRDPNRPAANHKLPRLRKPDRWSPSQPVISVFGSAQARRGGRLYAASQRMGALLGRAGFDLMTGGYDGVMEAVSRGAQEAGAHVTGVTLDRFGSVVNPHVIDEIPTNSFYERFTWMIDRADGYIAMHGGIGTLAEAVFAWQEIVVGTLSARPLILVGERWRRLLQVFRANLIAPAKIYDALTVVATPEAAMKVLAAHFAAAGIELKARERLGQAGLQPAESR
ncbi:MAG: LOG family protein [Candidatus Binataceae bacterium]